MSVDREELSTLLESMLDKKREPILKSIEFIRKHYDEMLKKNQSSIAAVSLPHSVLCTYNKTDFCFKIGHPCKYFLSANNAGLSSAAWKTCLSLENTLSGFNSTETVSWYPEISEKHLHFFRGPVNLYTSFNVAAQNILISSVDLRTFICSHTRKSPHWRQATIRTFWFNELDPERLSWKPHFWCGHVLCRQQMMTYNIGVTSKIVNNL